MARRMWIRGGTVVTEHDAFAADVEIVDGIIAGLHHPTPGEPAPPSSGQLASGEPDPGSSGNAAVVDATGCYVLPGAIDVHVHFRDPGLTHKEDFLTGSAAAVSGGVTTVFDMPNTVPPVSTAEIFAHKKAAVRGRSYVHYGLYGVITDGNADRLPAMAEAGACGWKVFLGPTTGDIKAPELGELLRLFQEVLPNLGLPVVFHAEDRSVIDVAQAAVAASGRRDYDAFLASRPRIGEIIATETAARLAECSGVPVHLAHVTLKEAVELVARHKKRGVPLTAETCPPYLWLSDAEAGPLLPEAKILPPIRRAADRAALWEGIADGTIDMVATDHAPHLPEEKAGAPDLWSTPGGSPGVETFIPLMLDAAASGRISLPHLVRLVSANPARLFGLYPRKGALQPGADADLFIADLNASAVIDETRFRGKVKRSLFHGKTVKGQVRYTIVGGRIAARDGEPVGEPSGRFIPGSPRPVTPAG